jgi:hypothetical protein
MVLVYHQILFDTTFTCGRAVRQAVELVIFVFSLPAYGGKSDIFAALRRGVDLSTAGGQVLPM